MGKQQSTGYAPHEIVDDRCTVTAVHGAFHGSAMPAAAIEALIATRVPKKHIQEVAEVYNTKWWDYRRMSPGHCFMLFANVYYRQFRIAAKKMLNHRRRTGGDISVKDGGVGIIGIGEIQFSAEVIWEREQKHITSMWNAMLVADAIGIPYQEFCRLGNQFAIERAWNRLPKPNHLYGHGIAGKICDEWVNLSKDKMFTANHPHFLTSHYIGDELQEEYRDWLVGELGKRENPVPALANVIFHKPQLPESEALKHFPRQAVNRAKLLAG